MTNEQQSPDLADPQEFVPRTRETPPAPPASPAPPQEQQRRIGFAERTPYLTLGLLGLLVLIHLYTTVGGREHQFQLYNNYANVYGAVLNGEYYRLLTSMFLHANLTHLAFNAFGLYVFGREVETLFGHLRFAAVYFLGGLAGSVASFAVTQGNSIGASGAVFAIFGAVAAYFYTHRKLYGKSANDQLRSLAVMAAINLAIGLLSNVPGSRVRIDNAAHIGGAVGGFVLAYLIGPRYVLRLEVNPLTGVQQRLIDTSRRWVWLPAAAAFALALIVVVLAVVATG